VDGLVCAAHGVVSDFPHTDIRMHTNAHAHALT